MSGAGLRVVRGGKGSDAARSFELRYRESYPMVYNYVLRRMASREAAEDVVSEAYLHAARAYGRYDPARARFSTWVITIACNCMRDWWAAHPTTAPLEEIAEGAYAEDGEHDAGLADRDLVERLLRVLDDEERELVHLKYYEGRRNVEIAERLGMNASTISTKLARAMAKMRAAAPQGA